MDKLNKLELIHDLKQGILIGKSSIEENIDLNSVIRQLALEMNYQIIINDMDKAKEYNTYAAKELYIPLFIAKLEEPEITKPKVLVYDISINDILSLNSKYKIMGGIY